MSYAHIIDINLDLVVNKLSIAKNSLFSKQYFYFNKYVKISNPRLLREEAPGNSVCKRLGPAAARGLAHLLRRANVSAIALLGVGNGTTRSLFD